MKEFVDVLDEAVSQLRDGDEVNKVLVTFPTDAPELAPLLESVAALTQLAPVEMPARADLAADRYHFLEQAEQLRTRGAAVRSANFAGLAISPGLFARLKMWTQKTFRWPFPARTEERRPMFALLVKMIVIAAIGLGVAGGTVAAASESLPDTALYPVKIGIEDVRLALANGPADEAELTMAFVQERVQEMRQLALAGEVPTEALMNRFHVQLQTALRHMAQIDDDAELTGLMLQTRQQIMAEVNDLAQTQLQVREQARVRLEEAQGALVRAGDDIDAGIAEPALYRYRYAENRPEDAPDQPDVLPPPVIQQENQLQQQGPSENAPGPQNGVAPGETPLRNQEDNGPSENRPDFRGDPERDRQESGPNPESPAGTGEPVQNQYRKGSGDSTAPAGEPDQTKQQGPSSAVPVEGPALVAAQTATQTGPLADPPSDTGLLYQYYQEVDPAMTQTATQAGLAEPVEEGE
jgi:hypothetical protein